MPVGAEILGACAISASLVRLWKDRFDLLEDWEKTRERGESKESLCRETSKTRRGESARLILVVKEDIDSWETCRQKPTTGHPKGVCRRGAHAACGVGFTEA